MLRRICPFIMMALLLLRSGGARAEPASVNDSPTGVPVSTSLQQDADAGLRAAPVSAIMPDSQTPRLASTGVEPTPVISRAELQEARDLLKSIDKKVSKPDETWFEKLMASLGAALVGFLGAVLGIVASYVLQDRALKQQAANQQRILEQQAAFQRSTIVEQTKGASIQWQLKQLSELYGPVNALLQQSQALYRQLGTSLCSMDPARFKLIPTQAPAFTIEVGGAPVRFRTVLHLRELYGKNSGIDGYFDEIVKIGGRLSSVISEKAGYTRSDDRELPSLFGRYLAHFAVLKRIYDDALPASSGKETDKRALPLSQISQSHTRPEGNSMKVSEDAAFPVEIHEKVRIGFDALNKALESWQGASTEGRSI